MNYRLKAKRLANTIILYAQCSIEMTIKSLNYCNPYFYLLLHNIDGSNAL